MLLRQFSSQYQYLKNKLIKSCFFDSAPPSRCFRLLPILTYKAFYTECWTLLLHGGVWLHIVKYIHKHFCFGAAYPVELRVWSFWVGTSRSLLRTSILILFCCTFFALIQYQSLFLFKFCYSNNIRVCRQDTGPFVPIFLMIIVLWKF